MSEAHPHRLAEFNCLSSESAYDSEWREVDLAGILRKREHLSSQHIVKFTIRLCFKRSRDEGNSNHMHCILYPGIPTLPHRQCILCQLQINLKGKEVVLYGELIIVLKGFVNMSCSNIDKRHIFSKGFI